MAHYQEALFREGRNSAAGRPDFVWAKRNTFCFAILHLPSTPAMSRHKDVTRVFPQRVHLPERLELCLLFLFQAHAQALWYVPFSNVLVAHGYQHILKYAYACGAIAAFISPMTGGALADRRFPAERILRWLFFGTGVMMSATFFGISHGWKPGWVLACLQMQQLFYSPAWGLSGAIVLSQLRDPERQFGIVRVWATLGWMSAGVMLSYVFNAETSSLTGYLSAGAFLLLGVFTKVLPTVPPSAPGEAKTWRERLGWDALVLLKHPDHRAVFVSSALFNIPLAAFYPFTIMHLKQLGAAHPTALMSVGQLSEIVAMFLLGGLIAKYRLKTLFLAGIIFGIMRYALFSFNTEAFVLAGIALHGLCYTLFFIPAQIYLERRVDSAFRARAQNLLTLMLAGFGNIFGYLGCGWWQEHCSDPTGTRTDWTTFWSVLCVAVIGVFVYFATAYRGLRRIRHTAAPAAVALAVPAIDGVSE